MNQKFDSMNIKEPVPVLEENKPVDTMSSVLSTVCLTGELADVYFRFPGDIRIPAHKTLLSFRSPVFKAMFYGTFPLAGGDVAIDDIDDSIFRIFLRFLYTDQVTFDKDNVIFLMNIANKYQVTSLLSKCGSYLAKNLNNANVCSIYRHARFFCINDLIQKSESFIKTNTKNVCRDNDFLSLSTEDLKEILKLEKLNINEVDLFRAVLRWADNELNKTKQTITNKTRRELLLKDNILYLIAIPVLSMDDYTNVVLPTCILNDEEQLQVFKAMTMHGPNKPSTRFDASPRNFEITIISINDLIQQPRLGYGEYNHNYTSNLREHFEIRMLRKSILRSVTIRPMFQNWSCVDKKGVVHLHWCMDTASPSSCVKIQLSDKAVEVQINKTIESNSAISGTFTLFPPRCSVTTSKRNVREEFESGCPSEDNFQPNESYRVAMLPTSYDWDEDDYAWEDQHHRRYMFTKKFPDGTTVLLNISVPKHNAEKPRVLHLSQYSIPTGKGRQLCKWEITYVTEKRESC